MRGGEGPPGAVSYSLSAHKKQTSIIPLNPTVFGRSFLGVESKMAIRVPCQVGLAEINHVLLGEEREGERREDAVK